MYDPESAIAGPISNDLLKLQVKHRSHTVWHDESFVDNKVYHVRYEGSLPSMFKDERVLENLRTAGFYGVHRVQPIRLDHGLITALVERWRPELHAFHFPFGEMGITLQDVECLLGLPIDGYPVVGYSLTTQERDNLFRDVLLWNTEHQHFGHPEQFKISLLFEGQGLLPNQEWPDRLVRQYTARLIYAYMGGLLFPESSGCYAPTDLVRYLQNFQETSTFSWGSAVLARLSYSLCRATLKSNRRTRPGGCLLLLQLWAWTRILTIRPVVNNVLNSPHGPPHEDDPFGARWRQTKMYSASARQNVRYFRNQNLSEEAFKYLNDIPRTAWTLYFDGGYRCGVLTTNGSESFNNMLKGCRMLPVTAILSMSYAKMVELFTKRHKLGVQWQQQSMHITPKIIKILLNREKTKHKWTVTSYGNNTYVVTHTSRTDPSSIYNYLVDLSRTVCTCGQWTSDAIPCVHVHAVFHSFRQQVPHNILPAKYSVQNYLSCYSGLIQPIVFPQNLDVSGYKVLPPKRPTCEITCSGRRQQNRYQGEMDYRAAT